MTWWRGAGVHFTASGYDAANIGIQLGGALTSLLTAITGLLLVILRRGRERPPAPPPEPTEPPAAPKVDLRHRHRAP